MARRARMIGVAGLLAVGAGLGLAVPASAAPTPPDAALGLAAFGNTCDDANGQRDLIFQIDLNRGGDTESPVDVSNFTVSFDNSTAAAIINEPFEPDPIPSDQDVSTASVSVPPTEGTITASVTITAQAGPGDAPAGESEVLNFGPLDVPACDPVDPPSSTSSTTSTTTGETTSTTAGATTTTVAGSTTSTSTTLGPNDTTGALTVTPTTIVQGSNVTVAGTGFAPNVDVTLTLFSDPISLGTLRSNASGAISGSVSMPASAAIGAHKLEAKGPNTAGGNNILAANVQVTAPGTGSRNIPRTGDTSDLLLPIGIAVVSFGILAFAWRERRLTQG